MIIFLNAAPVSTHRPNIAHVEQWKNPRTSSSEPQVPRRPLSQPSGLRANREKLDLTRLPHELRLFAEVAFRLEAPDAVGNDPVLETLDVQRDLSVDLRTPRRDDLPALEEPVERLLPELVRLLDRALAVDAVLRHENANEVVRLYVAARQPHDYDYDGTSMTHVSPCLFRVV